MKKLLKYGVAAIAAGELLASTANAVLLSNLIAANGSLNIDDKTFADFGVSPNAPGEINVSVGTDGNGNYFIQFQGPISSGVGGNVNISLQYSFTALGGGAISAINQGFTLAAGGNGGTVSLVETVRSGAFNGPGVAQSTVGFILGSADLSDPSGEITQGDQLSVNPGLTKVFVTEEIHMIANPGSIVSATVIHQGFHHSIPDGGSTLLLLGSALSGLSFFGLRRKS